MRRTSRLCKHCALKMTRARGDGGKNTDEALALDLCFLFLSLRVSEPSYRAYTSFKKLWCFTENGKSFSRSIYFSLGHLVWNYISIICCVSRGKIVNVGLFGRADRLVISVKLSAFSDVSISATAVPAWQHTPRQQPSQSQ